MRNAIILLSLLASLVSCGKPEPMTEAPPAAATDNPPESMSSGPGIAADAAPDPSPAPPLQFLVRLSNGRGADARINEVMPDDSRVFVATVPENGLKVMDAPCSQGQRFQAEPMVAAFLRTDIVECARTVEFVLYAVQVMNAIIREGDDAMTAGNLQVAQAKYGFAADRIQYANPARARELRELSTIAAGRVLGVDQPLDPGSSAPSLEFKDRIRKFQSDTGLAATGELDGATRDSIRRMELRNDAVVVPPAARDGGQTLPVTAVRPDEKPVLNQARINASDAVRVEASPETARIIHANRTATTMRGPQKP